MQRRSRAAILLLLVGVLFTSTVPASAQVRGEEWLCDSSIENCRVPLIALIRAETVGIDVGFWFMEDTRYATELIARHRAGVPVRVLMDTKATPSYPGNGPVLQQLRDAGISMRRMTSSYLHWKMMLFAGQNTVEFGSANYSPHAFVPQGPGTDFIDETIYFSNDPAVVGSFRTQFDNAWVSTTRFANYANITTPLTRAYGPAGPIDPELSFPTAEDFAVRSVGRYNAETVAIDSIMFRITDDRHTNALVAARRRGIPVRLLTEPVQYRDARRFLHSRNVDLLYMAGVQIRHRRHLGQNHGKLTLLRSQEMAIFGSQNWTTVTGNQQYEHNYFTVKPWIYQWFSDQFERKWNSDVDTQPFVPLPPNTPAYSAPARGAQNQPATVTLRWNAGLWAHKYDIHFGTASNPPILAADVELGNSTTATDYITYEIPQALQPDTTYYWKIVSKTMANMSRTGPTWSFRTAPVGTPDLSGDIVLWTSTAPTVAGAWTVIPDPTAAGAAGIGTPEAGVRVSTPLADPESFFEMTFAADAGVPYRLWLRGRAAGNSWPNDSAFVQFSDSVTSTGAATWRLGTASATTVTIEDCTSCGLAAWGWNDNLTDGAAGALGTPVYFETSGMHTVRVQMREDGLSIDQLVLSRDTYMTVAPGLTKNDGTILVARGGTAAEPPPPPPPAAEIVLHASTATTVGNWAIVTDTTAATERALVYPNANRAKVSTPYGNPNNYAELTFTAVADTPYFLWVRGRADGDLTSNDSVHVQFTDSIDAAGAPAYRIGSATSAEIVLEPCSGCGISGWGWRDNGWGSPATRGPEIRFATSGTKRIRIQNREDGLLIDQIVLSPAAYRTNAPGTIANDTTILFATP